MELNGWNEYTEEGLNELERIKSSNFFAGKDELIDLIQRYINIYKNNKISQKNQIGPTKLYPELVEQKALEVFREAEGEKALESLHAKSHKHQSRRSYSDEEAIKACLEAAAKNKELRKTIEKPAQDKASKCARQLREYLKKFYDSAEGKESEYKISFVTDTRDYRLKVEPRVEMVNSRHELKAIVAPATRNGNAKTDLPSQDVEPSNALEKLGNFFKDLVSIYLDVWKAFPYAGFTQGFARVTRLARLLRLMRITHECGTHESALRHLKQDDIISRVRNSTCPKWNAIFALISSLGIVVALFWNFISQIEKVPCTLDMAIWQAVLINWLKGKVLSILMPGAMILFIFVLVNSLALHLIYKLFGGKSTFHETFNLNLYFFSAWLAFIAKGAMLAITPMNSYAKNILGYLFLSILIYGFCTYVLTLNKLMEVSCIKGVPAFFLFTIAYFIILKPLF